MNGIFCTKKPVTDEEFKKVIKRRMMLQAIMFVLGVGTFGIALYVKQTNAFELADFLQGFYSGVGSGLTFVSALLFIKNALLLKNEKKLKQQRITEGDERLLEINRVAFQMATVVLLIALYIICFVGGVKYPVLLKMLGSAVSIFLLAYVIIYKILEKKN